MNRRRQSGEREPRDFPRRGMMAGTRLNRGSGRGGNSRGTRIRRVEVNFDNDDPEESQARSYLSENEDPEEEAGARNRTRGRFRNTPRRLHSSCTNLNTNDNRTMPSRFPKQIGLKYFRDLLDEEPLAMILKLKSENFKFSELFNDRGVKKEVMFLVLKVLAKASECSHRANLSVFLYTIPQDKFIQEVQKFLCGLQKPPISEGSEEALENLLGFLFCFQNTLPSMGNQIYELTEPFIQKLVVIFQRHGKDLSKNALHLLTRLEENKNTFFDDVSEKTLKKISVMEKIQSKDPPNNFRDIEILPTNDDLDYSEKPFLRPNITEGRYMDAEHYLDVQFRLLREDFVRPLRDGIQDYKLSLTKPKGRQQLKDIKVYTDVKILYSLYTEGGSVNVLKFNEQALKNVRWESSKRLIFGSLICLTRDNFETVLYATVANRDPKLLKAGYLEAKLENVSDEVLFESRCHTFIMVESSAYFESYRYVLSGLQKMTVDHFPFKSYIVDVEKEVRAPEYLNDTTLYNLSPLLLPLPSTDKLEKSTSSSTLKSVCILDTKSWPSSETCGLDEHQYLALQAGLTKEFAVIQGPPGTGKTYIGLRIVQVLLKNHSVWTSTLGEYPILIVCYTNHALDQFLEGILPLTKDLVRVGGRCQNETLDNFQITQLKKTRRLERRVPKNIHLNLNEVRSKLKDREHQIQALEKLISNSSEKLLTLNDLSKYVNRRHCDSLQANTEVSFDKIKNMNTNYIWKWLDGINFDEEMESEEEDEEVDDLYNEMVEEIIEEIVPDIRQEIMRNIFLGADDEANIPMAEEEEVDLEAIYAMREIDRDEFKHEFNILKEKSMKKRYNAKEPKNLESDGWQYQKGGKRKKNYVQKQIKKRDSMSVVEENQVENVYDLIYKDRWRLYRTWVIHLVQDSLNQIKALHKEFQELAEQLKEIRMAEDISLVKQAKIVGMTTTGASKYQYIIEHIGARIVIVEEAAEVLEAHILTSMTKKTKHLILIGDHQQLRPSPTVYQLAKDYNLEISLFERMVANNLTCNKLVTQHRMRPCISKMLVPHIYKELKDHCSVQNYENIKGMSKNVYFLTHNCDENKRSDSRSHSNMHEAEILVALCKYLRLQGYSASQITILTTYSSQMFAIRQMTKTEILKDVRVTAVDNYQGEENDIILVSFVRSNEEGNIGFLKISNRVCVALSRAKKGLYCVGNFGLLFQKSEVWKNIIYYLKRKGFISTSLKLQCQNHPQNTTIIKKASDFQSAPEGGCTLPCSFRLECGHTCSKICHTYDMEHEKFKCEKPCQNIICEFGHKCTKYCYQDCGDCEKIVKKRIPSCLHVVDIKCCEEPRTAMCKERCKKISECGHRCHGLCSQKQCSPCAELVPVKGYCGHSIFVKCSRKNFIDETFGICKEPCYAELACGHNCSGTCGSCYQKRIHEPCKYPCERIFLCGHACGSTCSDNCPPCRKKCENFCQHSKCWKHCGEPCVTCKEKCQWNCIHAKCENLCHEDCNREVCNEPCLKKLNCGHECMGFCGEPCPGLCGICDGPELKEIFFGTEEDEGARFVVLEDCGHVLESEGLRAWMEAEDSQEIQMKSCPKCKTVIRRNYQFGNIIKRNLRNIESVKNKISGNPAEILEIKHQIIAQNRTISKSHFENLEKSEKDDLRSVIYCIQSNTKDLLSDKRINKEKLILYLNVLSFIEEIQRFDKSTSLPYLNSIDSLKKFTKLTLRMIVNTQTRMIFDNWKFQMEDIENEVKRLRMIDTACSWANQFKNNSRAIPYIENITALLQTQGAYTQQLNDRIRRIMNDANKRMTGIGITPEEQAMVLKAMKQQKGHWFKCPNGHIYCIADCGGAMIESKCNECGAKIGGGNHTLRQDNALAGEMDGARYAAWSNMANMNNFDLRDLV